jgi:hypothetical protein
MRTFPNKEKKSEYTTKGARLSARLPWLPLVDDIFVAVSSVAEQHLFEWNEISCLFGIDRRAASRIIASLGSCGNIEGNAVSREQLLAFLEPIRRELLQHRLEKARLAAKVDASARRFILPDALR